MEKEIMAAKGYSFRRCICEKDLPENCPYKKEEEFRIRDSFKGHQLGVVVGHKKGEELVSNFVSDRDGETTILQYLIDNDCVESKVRCTRSKDETEFSEKEYYYITYKIVDHSSMKPTTTRNIDFCMNTTHEVTYEVMLVSNEWENVCRYITFSYKTAGTHALPFFNQVEDLEQQFKEMYDECTNGIIDYDDYKVFRMYDEFGDDVDVEIDNAYSLMKMIASVRLLEVKTEIKDKY